MEWQSTFPRFAGLLYLVALAFLSSATVCAQHMTGHKIGMDLHKCYAKLLEFSFGSDAYSVDSIEKQNTIFRSKMDEYTKRYPYTISYKFDSLSTDHIYIATSSDGLFRKYSWDTWLGGTGHNFENIWQYKTGAK